MMLLLIFGGLMAMSEAQYGPVYAPVAYEEVPAVAKDSPCPVCPHACQSTACEASTGCCEKACPKVTTGTKTSGGNVTGVIQIRTSGPVPAPPSPMRREVSGLVNVLKETQSPDTFLLTARALSMMELAPPEAGAATLAVILGAERLGISDGVISNSSEKRDPAKTTILMMALDGLATKQAGPPPLPGAGPYPQPVIHHVPVPMYNPAPFYAPIPGNPTQPVEWQQPCSGPSCPMPQAH